MGWKEFVRRRSLRARDGERTKAAELTIRESLYPIILVTILFFLWGFSYGLLDTLNKYVRLQAPRRQLHELTNTGKPQTLPKYPRHHQIQVIGAASRLLRVCCAIMKKNRIGDSTNTSMHWTDT